MLFNSYTFLFLFLPATFLGFLLFSNLAGPRSGKAWLTLTSLFFYGWWNPVYLALIIPSILANFALGKWIQKRASLRLSTAPIACFAVAANLLVLGNFKYPEILSTNLSALVLLEQIGTNFFSPVLMPAVVANKSSSTTGNFAGRVLRNNFSGPKTATPTC
jgi:hypothetical protein